MMLTSGVRPDPHSLFADQEREVMLNELGDTLRVLQQHADFAALAAKVDDAERQAPK